MAPKYDIKKTLKKVSYLGVYLLIAGVLSVWQDNPYLMLVAPVLYGIQDAIKHNAFA